MMESDEYFNFVFSFVDCSGVFIWHGSAAALSPEGTFFEKRDLGEGFAGGSVAVFSRNGGDSRQ